MSREDTGSFSSRISLTRIRVADYVEDQKAVRAAEEGEQVLRRVRNVLADLSAQQEVVERLNGSELSLRPVSSRLRESIVKAKTRLRSLSTQMKDPSSEVRKLITTTGLDSALGDAERLVVERDRAILNAFTHFREVAIPATLNEVQAEGLEPLSLSTRVRRLKRTFDSSVAIQRNQVPGELQKIEAALVEWRDIEAEVESAKQNVPKALEIFFQRLPGGVAWTEVKEEVRLWLDAGSNGDNFVVVRRDAAK
jgi:hypothetical protein